MTSFDRKLKRNKTKEAEKELQQKAALFSMMPDECSACSKAFNKLDRNQVMSWSVVVRAAERAVRLYCPDCWKKARSVLAQIESENNA